MKKLKYFFHVVMVAAALAATVSACSKDEPKQDYNPLIDDPKTEEPNTPSETDTKNSYNEQYRPQIHFTPAKNWMNDPNGMVYVDGVFSISTILSRMIGVICRGGTQLLLTLSIGKSSLWPLLVMN